MNKKLLSIIALIIVIGIGSFTVVSGQKNASTSNQVNNEQTNQAPITEPIETEANNQIQNIQVALSETGFAPNEVSIKLGTKVVWTNRSGRVATVDSDLHPTHQLYPPLNLGQFGNNETVELVFEKAGTFKYHNHLNPNVTGAVVVQE